MSAALDFPLPPSLNKVAAIRRIYPDLYASELRKPYVSHGPRDPGAPSWAHLRRMAHYRYARQHPGTPASVTFIVKRGGDIRTQFRAVWDRYGIPSWRQRRMECFVEHEGGFDVMDRWYGGATGWHPEYVGSDRVVGPGQQRPYHASKVFPQLRGRDSVVSYDTFRAITNPWAHARIMARLGDDAYAGVTRYACS